MDWDRIVGGVGATTTSIITIFFVIVVLKMKDRYGIREKLWDIKTATPSDFTCEALIITSMYEKFLK